MATSISQMQNQNNSLQSENDQLTQKSYILKNDIQVLE